MKGSVCVRLIAAVIATVSLSGCALTADIPQKNETDVSYPIQDAQTGYEQSNDAPAINASDINSRQAEGQESASLVISEIMSSNKTVVLADEAGFPDWIELRNTGTSSISTQGLYLSDDSDDLTKWQFPVRTVAPGECILVMCKKTDASSDEMFSNFSLNKDGCEVILSDSEGLIERVRVPALKSDQAYLPEQDRITRDVTPGYPEDEVGRAAYINTLVPRGPVVINEVAVYNDSFNRLPGCYPDWVEIKNISDEPILLSDYYIGDSTREAHQRRLPGITLLPGKLHVVFFVGEHKNLVTRNCFDLSLSSDDEQVYLFDSSGSVVDCIGIYEVPLRGTVGRMDSENGFFLFKKGSPSKQNSGGLRTRCDIPVPSLEPGCYDDVDKVTVELSGDGQIYYTLDGKKPDRGSILYTEPVVLTESTVIRAFCSREDKLDSAPVAYSYYVNEGFTLPVVSLTADGFNKVYNKKDDSCDAIVSYFGEDGSFYHDCKFELHGTSASSYDGKKGYKVTFSGRFGGDLEYDVFEDGRITRFHSLNLRGSVISCAEIHLFRDSLVSVVVNKVYPKDMDPLTLNNKYCVLYINGKYYGVYALREAYSPMYSASHLGGSEDDYVIGRPHFQKANELELRELVDFIIDSDMSVPDNYAYAADRLDMRSLALWYCVESYFNNKDSGNIRYTRNTAEDGKWYVMVYDFDLAMENGNAQWKGILEKENTSISKILASLLKNPEFCNLLLASAAELREGGLSDELVQDTFSELVDQVSADMPRDLEKWGIARMEYDLRLAQFYDNFSNGRMDRWLSNLQSLLQTDDLVMHEYFPDKY